jgi:hypothetical protein
LLLLFFLPLTVEVVKCDMTLSKMLFFFGSSVSPREGAAEVAKVGGGRRSEDEFPNLVIRLLLAEMPRDCDASMKEGACVRSGSFPMSSSRSASSLRDVVAVEPRLLLLRIEKRIAPLRKSSGERRAVKDRPADEGADISGEDKPRRWALEYWSIRRR